MYIYIRNSFNIVMLSTILLLINSCGNSSNSNYSNSIDSIIIQPSSQEEVLRRIRGYSVSVNNPIPTVDDYKNAGVIGVDDNNIEDINYIISYLDVKQIETKEQLTTFVDNFSKPNITPLANAGDDLIATEGRVLSS